MRSTLSSLQPFVDLKKSLSLHIQVAIMFQDSILKVGLRNYQFSRDISVIVYGDTIKLYLHKKLKIYVYLLFKTILFWTPTPLVERIY